MGDEEPRSVRDRKLRQLRADRCRAARGLAGGIGRCGRVALCGLPSEHRAEEYRDRSGDRRGQRRAGSGAVAVPE